MAEEHFFKTPRGTIAAKIWGNPQGIPILALHGWLDNAASFDMISPLLSNCHIVAIDLIGHGLSSHRSSDATLHIIDFIIDLMPVLEMLQWQQFVLMGHSLGAALASLLAGTLPNRCKALIAIDGLGPMSLNAEHSPHQLELYLQEWSRPRKTRYYDNLQHAVQARLRVNKMHPTSCEILLSRGLKEVGPQQWIWRTDPRLLQPSALQLTENQVLAFLEKISCPSLLIRPEPGFPFTESIMRQRVAAVANLQIAKIVGHHHAHMDQPDIVSELINNFLVDHQIERAFQL